MCVPCLAAVALALFVCGIPKVAAAVTAVVGGFSLLVGWALQDAPLTAEWGSRIGVGGGIAAVLGAIAVITIALLNESTGASDRAPARERSPRACVARNATKGLIDDPDQFPADPATVPAPIAAAALLVVGGGRSPPGSSTP